jgi:hypothetical protein
MLSFNPPKLTKGLDALSGSDEEDRAHVIRGGERDDEADWSGTAKMQNMA